MSCINILQYYLNQWYLIMSFHCPTECPDICSLTWHFHIALKFQISNSLPNYRPHHMFKHIIHSSDHNHQTCNWLTYLQSHTHICFKQTLNYIQSFSPSLSSIEYIVHDNPVFPPLVCSLTSIYVYSCLPFTWSLIYLVNMSQIWPLVLSAIFSTNPAIESKSLVGFHSQWQGGGGAKTANIHANIKSRMHQLASAAQANPQPMPLLIKWQVILKSFVMPNLSLRHLVCHSSTWHRGHWQLHGPTDPVRITPDSFCFLSL